MSTTAHQLDDTYIGWRLQVVVGVFLPLVAICVGLRFYARHVGGRQYGWDDWLVIASLLGQVVLSALNLGSVAYGGVGYNISYVAATNPEAITIFFKYLVAIPIWYMIIISIPKLAILVVYRQIFPQKPMVIFIWVLATALIINSILGVILLCVVCRPFHMNWASVELQNEHCFDRRGIFVWFSIPSIVTDTTMILMPLPIVWNLRMANQLKVALTATFLIGGSGLVASIMRFAGFLDNESFVNATWNGVILLTWTEVEPAIYLISACIMMYRPLLEKLFANSTLLTKSRTTRTGGTSQNSLQSRKDIEMGLRNPGGAHRFERLAEAGEEAPDVHSTYIRVRTDIAVPRGV